MALATSCAAMRASRRSSRLWAPLSPSGSNPFCGARVTPPRGSRPPSSRCDAPVLPEARYQALLALLLTADMGYERLYPLLLRPGGDAVVTVGLVRFPVHPFALATCGLTSSLVPSRMRIS